jgi:hypothetical protein
LLTISVAGGLWHPDAQHVSALRHDIDQHPAGIKRILQNPDFRKEYLGGIGPGEKAVEAFIAQNKESALKTKPKVCSLPLIQRTVISFQAIRMMPAYLEIFTKDRSLAFRNARIQEIFNE